MQENFPINFPRRCDDSALPCFATCFKILKCGVPKKRGVPTFYVDYERIIPNLVDFAPAFLHSSYGVAVAR